MAERDLNLMTSQLRDFCAEHVLEEKRLLAPTRRIGYQWMESVTLAGQPVLNLRVETFLTAALELAAPEMEGAGVSLLRGVREEVVAARAFEGMRGRGRGYLSRLDPSPGLTRSIMATLRDLRGSGITSGGIDPRPFEVKSKGEEIALLLEEYERALESEGLVDYAGVLRLAVERLRRDPSALAADAYLLVPRDVLEASRKLERDLWEAVPADRRVVLDVDPVCGTPQGELSDSRLLGWAPDPSSAPQPARDGTAEIFRARGEVNEVREVLRKCLRKGMALDEVEIIYTDTSTYLPLLYELCFLLAPEAGETLPVTFYEGVSTRYCRPGRALLGWLSWTREGYPQPTLVRMVQDGLLRVEGAEAEGISYSRLGAVLRSLPIGGGWDRYLPAIDAAIRGLEKRILEEGREEDENGHPIHRGESLARRLRALQALRGPIRGLLGLEADKTGRELLSGAELFLDEYARCASQMDEYSRGRLLEEIRELANCLDDEAGLVLDVGSWLAELAHSSQVGGQGPRPGCLYVSPLRAGGHSGRKYTFIMGLDDGRFPGPGLQDPLVLDAERKGLSEDLPTAAGRLSGDLAEFYGLLARLRGEVTMSYCCRSLDDDRDMFPSPVLLSAFRVLSGNPRGDQDDLLQWLPPTASFAPQDPGDCLDVTDWWLWRLCEGRELKDPLGAVTAFFPHLARGLLARAERESDRFTAYDGFVPEAGEEHDPCRPGGPVLSTRRLETLGRCPLDYFFRYVLEIEAPEEPALDPAVWLEPAERGALLHAAFREFMRRLKEQGRLPQYERDREMMRGILEEEISRWRARKPPPSREVLEREVGDLELTARIFLREEELLCRERIPTYFEAAVGLEPEGGGNPIDHPEPVEIELPDGRAIRVRGRIDRVDELRGGGGAYCLCDYKTGSSRKFDRGNPFQGGRRIQHALYLALARKRLEECHPGAKVAFFEYFFPNTREHGERLRWEAEKLAGGAEVLRRLCDMLAGGCFPFTDDSDEAAYSDYGAAVGKVETAAKAVAGKLRNPANQALRPFRELRGYQDDARK